MLKAGLFMADSSIGFAPGVAWRSLQLIQTPSSVSWVGLLPVLQGLRKRMTTMRRRSSKGVLAQREEGVVPATEAAMDSALGWDGGRAESCDLIFNICRVR